MANISISGFGGPDHTLVRRATSCSRHPQTTSFNRSDLRIPQYLWPSSCLSSDQSPVKSQHEHSLYQLQDLSTSHRNRHPSPNLKSSPDILAKIREFVTSSSDERLEVKVPKTDSKKVFEYLESAGGSVRYTYSWIDEKLVVYPMASAAHEALISPITLLLDKLVNDIQSRVPQAQTLYLGSSCTDLEDAIGRHVRIKIPDASIDIKLDPRDIDSSVFPRIVFEIGVSETEAELDLDARHWLYETNGRTVSHAAWFLLSNVHRYALGTGRHHQVLSTDRRAPN